MWRERRRLRFLVAEAVRDIDGQVHVDVRVVRRVAPILVLIMTGRRGWLIGAGHPDPSLTRLSDVKTFNMLFPYKAGT